MPRSPVAAALLVPLLLAACSQADPTPDVADPYAGGVSYPWESSAPSSALKPLSLTPGTNTLYYEPMLAARNAWGPVEIDRSNGEQRAGDGKPLTLNGKVFKRGFGVHAGSELRFGLQGTGAVCTTFSVGMGVDDEVGHRGKVAFQIYLDGVKVYDSGPMTGATATRTTKLDVYSKAELRLVVTDGGDGIHFDHADWVDPQIECQTAAALSGRRDPNYGQGGAASIAGFGRPVGVLSSGQLVLIEQVVGRTVARRLTADGQLDTSYGVQGQLALPSAQQLTVYPDGRLLLAGRLPSGEGLVLRRYLRGGQPDPGFGQAGVSTLTDWPQGTGKIILGSGGELVMGASGGLARFTPDGRLDRDFGTGGFLPNAPSTFEDFQTSYSESIVDLAPLPGRRSAVLYNSSRYYGGLQGAAVRVLRGDEAPLHPFGADLSKHVTVGRLLSWPDGAYAWSVSEPGNLSHAVTWRRADGTYVPVAAPVGNPLAAFGADQLLSAQDYEGTLLRHTSDGRLDLSFGVQGQTPDRYQFEAVLVQPDRRILIVGSGRVTRIFP